jgi:hypothetical protein
MLMLMLMLMLMIMKLFLIFSDVLKFLKHVLSVYLKGRLRIRICENVLKVPKIIKLLKIDKCDLYMVSETI